MKIFSYVMEHDTGHAPNPFFGACTLCRCKYRKCFGKPQNVVERAKPGDWVVGTGGADLLKSAGHGKIVYAMRVDKKITREDYYSDRNYARKKPLRTNIVSQLGDNLRPEGAFERRCQFVLVSHHFYYFGRKAILIPAERFPVFEKKGPGFRSDFTQDYVERFVKWIEAEYKPGRHGEPCQKPPSVKREIQICKSSCCESA
jgi:hypothetical protein